VATLKAIYVVGVHVVEPTSREFEIARYILCGSDLASEEIPAANRFVEKHYRSVHLIEIEVQPPDGEIDWLQITQPVHGKDRGEWQVPWDERALGDGRWAFFLHAIQFERPLKTPCGKISLPSPTSIPSRLESIKYELPG